MLRTRSGTRRASYLKESAAVHRKAHGEDDRPQSRHSGPTIPIAIPVTGHHYERRYLPLPARRAKLSKKGTVSRGAFNGYLPAADNPKRVHRYACHPLGHRAPGCLMPDHPYDWQ
jgi:hypothetical protein